MPVDIITRMADAKAAGTLPLRPPRRRLTRATKPWNRGRT